MSDDAYITLRTVEHFTSGLGPRYNVGERVQAFTHPLWLLLLSVPYALLGQPWTSAVSLGLLCSLLALWLLCRQASSWPARAVAAACLLSSKAAVDYATGGLENPLEGLLLVALIGVACRERPVLPLLVLLASLLGLTRLDALLLVGPLLGLLLIEHRARALAAWPRLLLATAPLWVWHAFALIYYGALLPNTAPAKLGAGLPALDLARQALWYAEWTARIDPVTLPALAAGCLLGLASRDRRWAALVLGVLLHLLWLLRIGGDFMGGRFFVAPLWVAATLVARARWDSRAAGLALALLAASALSPWSPLRSGPDYRKAPPSHGVVDERGYYFPETSLWGGAWRTQGSAHPFAIQGRAARRAPVSAKATIGLYGYFAGPTHHVVDRLALADPLLARLPAQLHGAVRIGHFRRDLPEGYLESVETDSNQIHEPDARALYEDIRLATRAPLLQPGRWAAIARLALTSPSLNLARWRWPEVRWLAPPPSGRPVAVSARGVGLRTQGEGLELSLSPGAWVLYASSDGRVRRLWGSSRVEIAPGAADLLVAFPPEGGGTLSVGRSAPGDASRGP